MFSFSRAIITMTRIIKLATAERSKKKFISGERELIVNKNKTENAKIVKRSIILSTTIKGNALENELPIFFFNIRPLTGSPILPGVSRLIKRPALKLEKARENGISMLISFKSIFHLIDFSKRQITAKHIAEITKNRFAASRLFKMLAGLEKKSQSKKIPTAKNNSNNLFFIPINMK